MKEKKSNNQNQAATAIVAPASAPAAAVVTTEVTAPTIVENPAPARVSVRDDVRSYALACAMCDDAPLRDSFVINDADTVTLSAACKSVESQLLTPSACVNWLNAHRESVECRAILALTGFKRVSMADLYFSAGVAVYASRGALVVARGMAGVIRSIRTAARVRAEREKYVSLWARLLDSQTAKEDSAALKSWRKSMEAAIKEFRAQGLSFSEAALLAAKKIAG